MFGIFSPKKRAIVTDSTATGGSDMTGLSSTVDPSVFGIPYTEPWTTTTGVTTSPLSVTITQSEYSFVGHYSQSLLDIINSDIKLSDWEEEQMDEMIRLYNIKYKTDLAKALK